MANRKWKHLVKATLSISWNIPLASSSRGWFLGRTDRGNSACPFKERGQVTVHHPTLLCSWAVKEASSFCSLFYDLHKQWIATTVPGARMASLAGGARRAKVEQRWVPPSSRRGAVPPPEGGVGVDRQGVSSRPYLHTALEINTPPIFRVSGGGDFL